MSSPIDLLQGDICRVDLFPQWHLKKSESVHDASGKIVKLAHSGLQGSLGAPEGGTYVAVCSHSCDIENPRARTGLIVAPITKVPARVESEEYRSIIDSATSNDGEFTWINLFPLQVEALPEKWCTVEYSAMASIAPVAMAAELLASRRVFRMDQATQDSFALKMAAFLGRRSN